jgi:hypothetical protein
MDGDPARARDATRRRPVWTVIARPTASNPSDGGGRVMHIV